MAVVAIGLAFGLCELVARMIFPRPPLASREPQIAFLYDPEIRYVMAPGQQGWIDDGLVSVNSLGFRGPEVASPKPPGRFRVVVVGDSLTLGWGVADDETYSARLERLSAPADFPDRISTWSTLASAGTTRVRRSRSSRGIVSRLEPDLVLVGFYSNDVPDALEDDEAPSGGGALDRRGQSTGRAGAAHEPDPDWLVGSTTPEEPGRLRRRPRVQPRYEAPASGGVSSFAMEIDMLEGRTSPQTRACLGESRHRSSSGCGRSRR